MFFFYYSSNKQISGCSSVVERNLAKVDVEGSNPFSRSIFFPLRLAKEAAKSAWKTLDHPLGTQSASMAEGLSSACSHQALPSGELLGTKDPYHPSSSRLWERPIGSAAKKFSVGSSSALARAEARAARRARALLSGSASTAAECQSSCYSSSRKSPRPSSFSAEELITYWGSRARQL